MNLQSDVYFTVNTKLFYKWHTESSIELRDNRKDKIIHVHTRENKQDRTKNKSEITQCVQDFCKDVATVVETHYLNKLTYDLSLTRYVCIQDIDDKKYFRQYNFPESREFILSTQNKLIYPNDIKEALKVPFYFRGIRNLETQLNPTVPVFIERYDEYYADVRPLTENDIVIGPNLIQLWPMDNPGKIPSILDEMLGKLMEQVHAI